MEIITYDKLGINKWLERDTSLLSDFQDVQFYSTLNIDPDTGETVMNQVSAGLSTVDTGKISQAEVDALLGNIRATQLTSGDISQPINLVSGHIQSSNFLTGITGWKINADGDVEFNSGTFRGDLIAGAIHIPDKNTTANSFHTDSTGNSWWGCTDDDFTSDNDNANAYILNTGVAKFQSITINGGVIDGTSTIGGRDGSDLATAINASSNLVTDIINARLDSSGKKILSDFSFGTDDYAGGVKSGDITWNTSTGALTGGSGIVVSRWGIIGANTGTPTFTIDASSGDATFAGTLSAAAGTLGTVTAGTLTGVTIKTATSGARIYLTGTILRTYAGAVADDYYSIEIGATGSRIGWFDNIGGTNTLQTQIDSDTDRFFIRRYNDSEVQQGIFSFYDDYFVSIGSDIGVTGANTWTDAYFTGKVNSGNMAIIQGVNTGIGLSVSRDRPISETSGVLVQFLNDNLSDDQDVVQIIQDGTGDGLYIYCRETTASAKALNILGYSDSGNPIYIDWTSDDDTNNIFAIDIRHNNVGTKLPGGIDMSSFSVDEPLIKATSDTINTAGTLSEQIAVDIGGTVYYLYVYTTGSVV